MADEKKEAKPADKPAASGSADPFTEILWFIAALYAGLYILNRVILTIGALFSGNAGENIFTRWFMRLFGFLSTAVFLYKFLAFVVSGIAIACIVYIYRELIKLRGNEMKLLYPAVESAQTPANPHWQRILDHIESQNENDWRLAILEADIMLSGLLDNLYLPGETMGEKLKAVEESDFTTIQNAWEAHKIRNQIAHEGVSFALNQREARRVIELYRSVFEEFQII